MRRRTWILALTLVVSLVIACSIEETERIQTNSEIPPSDDMLKLAKDLDVDYVSLAEPNHFEFTVTWNPLNDGDYEVLTIHSKEMPRSRGVVPRRDGKFVFRVQESDGAQKVRIVDRSERKSAIHNKEIEVSLPFDCVIEKANEGWGDEGACERIFFQPGSSLLVDDASRVDAARVIGEAKIIFTHAAPKKSIDRILFQHLQGSLEVEIRGEATHFPGYQIEILGGDFNRIRVKDDEVKKTGRIRYFRAGNKSTFGCGELEFPLNERRYFADSFSKKHFRVKPNGSIAIIEEGGGKEPRVQTQQPKLGEYTDCVMDKDSLLLTKGTGFGKVLFRLQGKLMSAEDVRATSGVNVLAAVEEFCAGLGEGTECIDMPPKQSAGQSVPIWPEVEAVQEALQGLAARRDEWLPLLGKFPIGIITSKTCDYDGSFDRRGFHIFCPRQKESAEAFISQLKLNRK